LKMPRRLSSEVDKVVRPAAATYVDVSQKSSQLFQGSSLSTSRLRRVRKRFLGSELYTHVRSVALEIAFVRQGHSHSLDRSRLFDRNSATTSRKNIRHVSLGNSPCEILMVLEDAPWRK